MTKVLYFDEQIDYEHFKDVILAMIDHCHKSGMHTTYDSKLKNMLKEWNELDDRVYDDRVIWGE